ncbi:UvrD-helicase domain-containing protein [Massilia sp. H-1]|nr:UvrD-helicase domain-containing protein [Massilia sp. H-1]
MVSQKGSQPLRGPFAQAFHYKDTFFNIHGNGLLEKRLKNENFYNVINVFVYFHKARKNDLSELYRAAMAHVKSRIEENNAAYNGGDKSHIAYDKAWTYLNKKLKAMERDAYNLSVTSENLAKIAFRSRGRNPLFEESVYDEFMRLLQPPFHYANQGRLIEYTKKQAQLIESKADQKIKIRGIAGSGKTTVLAKRAVNAHRRHGSQVLILTFNLTLSRYIKDKLNEVRDDYSWSNFHISNYHRFITSALGNAGVKVDSPPDGVKVDAYFDENFYSNIDLFLAMRSEHGSAHAVFDAKAMFRYETILIDEVQDYKPAWIKIIMDCFLAEGGELVLFGDEKQNIYHRSMDDEKSCACRTGSADGSNCGKVFVTSRIRTFLR